MIFKWRTKSLLIPTWMGSETHIITLNVLRCIFIRSSWPWTMQQRFVALKSWRPRSRLQTRDPLQTGVPPLQQLGNSASNHLNSPYSRLQLAFYELSARAPGLGPTRRTTLRISWARLTTKTLAVTLALFWFPTRNPVSTLKIEARSTSCLSPQESDVQPPYRNQEGKRAEPR